MAEPYDIMHVRMAPEESLREHLVAHVAHLDVRRITVGPPCTHVHDPISTEDQ